MGAILANIQGCFSRTNSSTTIAKTPQELWLRPDGFASFQVKTKLGHGNLREDCILLVRRISLRMSARFD